MSERAELTAWASAPRTLADAPIETLSDESRRDVLRHAVFLTLVDGDQDPSERTLIVALTTRLALPDADALVRDAAERARRLRELL